MFRINTIDTEVKPRLFFIILLFTLIFGSLGCVKKNDTVIEVPKTPSDLKGKVISRNQIQLTWTDNSTNEKGFKIQRKTGTGVFADIVSLGANITTYNDTSLTRSTIYTYRVNAFNEAGSSLSYSNEDTVNTWGDVQLTTKDPLKDFNFGEAISGGNITSDGGSPVTDRGIVWSQSPSPTILLPTKTSSGSGIGTFSSVLNGLIPGQKYFVRAYATNSEATFYGNEHSYIHEDLADVQTGWADEVTSTSAKLGGHITAFGFIIDHGIFWSTSQNLSWDPMTPNSFYGFCGTVCGFSIYLNSLTPNTTYYYSAYARSNSRALRGDTKSFTTLKTSPQLNTTSISAITTTSAKSGGNITSDGGYPILDRGVVWTTSPNPTVSSTTKTSNGLGIGTFSSNLTGLIPDRPYYVRAYVTNSLGTFYGNEIYFRTSK